MSLGAVTIPPARSIPGMGKMILAITLYAVVASGQSRTFDVASIKPLGDSGSFAPVCGARSGLQLTPGRLTATNTSLFALITWAYGIGYSCFIVSDEGLVSGGPKWVVSERYDIQATFSPDTPAYSAQQLQDGRAPEIQEMLRSLLEERFKVSLHKVAKEMSVYELTLTPGGTEMTPSRAELPKLVGISLEPDEKNEILVHLRGNKASIADMTHVIEPVTHTPVLDRTGIGGDYSFDLKFAVIEPFTGELSQLVGATSPTIFTVFEKELGLKLSRGKGSVEQWVIDHAEKPSEN